MLRKRKFNPVFLLALFLFQCNTNPCGLKPTKVIEEYKSYSVDFKNTKLFYELPNEFVSIAPSEINKLFKAYDELELLISYSKKDNPNNIFVVYRYRSDLSLKTFSEKEVILDNIVFNNKVIFNSLWPGFSYFKKGYTKDCKPYYYFYGTTKYPVVPNDLVKDFIEKDSVYSSFSYVALNEDNIFIFENISIEKINKFSIDEKNRIIESADIKTKY
jgi:hypothetical protein